MADDPMIRILACFEAIPVEHREAMFNDFASAAASKDLRRLQDAISDWAATAEVYHTPGMMAGVLEAEKEAVRDVMA